ncbi:MAG: hypothetical protein R2854_19510 [Caldilineaceae bacterium]
MGRRVGAQAPLGQPCRRRRTPTAPRRCCVAPRRPGAHPRDTTNEAAKEVIRTLLADGFFNPALTRWPPS